MNTFEALVNIEKRSRLAAVPPNFNLAVRRCFRNLAANGSRSFFFSSHPASLGTEDVMEACNSHLDTVVPHIGKKEPFTEKLFPPVFTVRSCWVRRLLGTFRIVGVELVIFRINTG